LRLLERMRCLEDAALVEEVADDLEATGRPSLRPQGTLDDMMLAEDARMSSVKQEARKLVDDLPDDANWDDVMDRVFLQQVIAAGLQAAREGRMRTVKEVRKSYGLPE
jgi:hypothetical protein